MPLVTQGRSKEVVIRHAAIIAGTSAKSDGQRGRDHAPAIRGLQIATQRDMIDTGGRDHAYQNGVRRALHAKSDRSRRGADAGRFVDGSPGRDGAVDHRLPEPGDALTGVEMFAGLEPDVRQRVIATAVPRTYRKGQILFVENDPGESLIILKRGAVAVFRTAPTGERAVLTVVRPPDVLGEVSLLDASTRSASAEAIEDCQALALSRPRSWSWCTPTRASSTR